MIVFVTNRPTEERSRQSKFNFYLSSLFEDLKVKVDEDHRVRKTTVTLSPLLKVND